MVGFRIIVVLMLISFWSEAQQLPLYTQYREQATLINPAAMEPDFIAFGNNVSVGASYRTQWAGMPGAPETQSLRFTYFDNSKSGVSLVMGGHIQNDQTGPTGFTGIYGKIGGVISSDPDIMGISFAITAGMMQYRIDPNKVFFKDPGETLGSEWLTKIFPDLGLGVYGYKMLEFGAFDGDFVYGGVSVPQLFALDIDFDTPDGKYGVTRVQHVYLNGGMYKYFSKESFLEPSIWLRYAGGELYSLDVNIRYQMPGPLWIGGGYGLNQMGHLEAGVLLGENLGLDRTIKIGYGYGYSYNSIGPPTGNTHELNLSLSFFR